MFKPIEWSEEFEPNAKCRYNHVVGNSPLGEFLISWKGWKEHKVFDLDELPCSVETDLLRAYTLAEAKAVCEKLLEDKLKSCLQNSLPVNITPKPTEGRAVRSKLSGSVYVITGDYGSRLTAVRSVDITNWSEWELL